MSLGILIIVGCMELVVLVYALCRNNWVHEQRIALLAKKDYATFKRLPSYDEMLWGHGFWRWNIDYYLRRKK